MDKDQIKKILEQLSIHERRLCALEEGGRTPTVKVRVKTIKKDSKRKKGSTEPITALNMNGFFKQSKNLTEVQTALKKRALNFDNKDLAVTMMRLVRKGVLERGGDGKKKTPWKYKSITQ
jgi:hypothetical protein